MRTLVPAETLVYLESNDLAAALQPIVDSKPFTDVAKSKPDLSALKGVQVAVAVTGFETTEEKLTDEHSVGRIQPHFVAVADTHAWNYQAVGFAEKKLGAFVEKIYDSEPTLEKSEKNGGKYFTWKANDGRKAYALVIDSLIYFGNDETAIDKCLAVRRGEADSIAKAGKVVPAAPGTLASGYVGPDGIAQIANIIGLKFASEMGDDSEVQSAVAGILPQLLRKSVTDVTWNATRTEKGIEDRYSITMPAEIANVFSETMRSSEQPDGTLLGFLPQNARSATIYNFRDPQIAWRSILLAVGKQTDPLAGKVFTQFFGILFEPYGIKDVELFLSGIEPPILTANLDAEGEKPIVIALINDENKVKHSFLQELRLNENGRAQGGSEFWSSNEPHIGAEFVDRIVAVGEFETSIACFNAFQTSRLSGTNEMGVKLSMSKANIASTGKDADAAGKIADMLSERKSDEANAESTYFTETRFTKTGIDRRTTSDFGLIGSIIAQLGQD